MNHGPRSSPCRTLSRRGWTAVLGALFCIAIWAGAIAGYFALMGCAE